MSVTSHITRRPRVFFRKIKKPTWKTQTDEWSKNINSGPRQGSQESE